MGTIIRPENKAHLIWAGNYTWHDRDGTRREGVALLAHQRVLQHLTPNEAIALADQLVDAAEAATRGDQPINHQSSSEKTR